MPALAVDTHAAIWYLNNGARLSATARAAMRAATASNQPLFLSAISIVEVCYLVDKGKLPLVALQRLTQSVAPGQYAALELVPLSLDIAQAVQQIPRAAVPDMPDRIIAATALHLGVPLVSRDRKIQASPILTIW
jgi:PIN domain nuclease of toxin-antitoxin system